jgi:type IV pilus assembly protein PilA
VIVVIGVLAAIALPSFLGKRQNADDADAKSNARNLVTYIDSCYTTTENYTKCATQADNDAKDMPWGSGPGQVEVTDTSKTAYTVTAVATGAGHTFTITRTAGGTMVRTCTAGPHDNDGGCRNGVW